MLASIHSGLAAEDAWEPRVASRALHLFTEHFPKWGGVPGSSAGK